MLRFREFLVETRWKQYLYHASYHDFDPQRIKPGTHFGTLRAAIERAHVLHHFGKGERAKLRVHAYAYEPGERRWRSDPQHRATRRPKHGHDEMYVNRHEDEGSVSHIVWNPHRLKHVKTFDQPAFIDRT